MTSSSITNNIQSISLNANKFYEYLNGMSVRVYNDTDNNPWFMAKDCAEILNYKDTRKAISDNVDIEDKCKLQNLKSGEMIHMKNVPPHSIFINKRGLLSLFGNSKKEVPDEFLVWLKANFSIDIGVEKLYRYYPKETETLGYIKQAFHGEQYETQYKCGDYYVDLYFPLYKIAIECDEHGHRYNNIKLELKRQRMIEIETGCKFIRYNPDEEKFSIFKVINEIYINIKCNKYHSNPSSEEE